VCRKYRACKKLASSIECMENIGYIEDVRFSIHSIEDVRFSIHSIEDLRFSI
jgi:hypothetical protein